MRLEEMAQYLRGIGLPIWIIVVVMLLPLLLRGVATFVRELVVGRAEAKREEASMQSEQVLGEGWRALVDQIRKDVKETRDRLEDCLKKHEECLTENAALGRRVTILEDNCRQCRLTEKLAKILNADDPPPKGAPGD